MCFGEKSKVVKAMKVIFITNLYPSEKEPYKGSFVKNIYDEFDNLGVDVQLIKLESFGELKWFKLLAFLFFYIRSFFYALFSKSEDVFYIHYASHSSLGILLAGFFRRLKIVTNVHGSDVLPEVYYGKYSSLVNCFLSNLILTKSAVVISPSQYFKKIIHDKYNIKLSMIFVSPSGGVNSSIFYPQNMTQVNESIRFGYIGRVEEAKGFFDLLSAYVELLKSHKNVSLTIIGSGSGYEAAQKISKKIESIELCHGLPQAKLAEQYSSFDYLVFPSHHESLGLVPIEAMMCGTPVISSTIGATSDYIRDGLTSLSFAPGNRVELLKSLNKTFLIGPEKYEELASLGIRIAQEYESKKVVNELFYFFSEKFDICSY